MTLAGFMALLKFFPELLDVATQIETLIAQGIDLLEIKAAIKSIDKDFLIKKAADRARSLNDVFRKP